MAEAVLIFFSFPLDKSPFLYYNRIIALNL